MCCFAHAAEAWSGSEGDGSSSGQNLRSVIEENLVRNTRSKRCPVHQCAAFDHHTRNLPLRQPAADGLKIGPAINAGRRDLLDLNSVVQERLFLLLFRKRAE